MEESKYNSSEYFLEKGIVDPSAALDGIDLMINQMRFFVGIVSNKTRPKHLSEIYLKRIEKLFIELNLIRELLEPRYKEFLEIDLDIIFKFEPKMITAFDELHYQELKGNNPKINYIESDQFKELEKTTESLQKNFKIVVKDSCYEKLYDFLIDNEFIDSRTNKNEVLKFLRLEAIPKNNRIIWIYSVQGKTPTRTLARIFYWLTEHKTAKRNFNLGYKYLIPLYFKYIKGEFNPSSIPTIMSIIEKDEPMINPQEEKLDRFLRSLTFDYK